MVVVISDPFCSYSLFSCPLWPVRFCEATPLDQLFLGDSLSDFFCPSSFDDLLPVAVQYLSMQCNTRRDIHSYHDCVSVIKLTLQVSLPLAFLHCNYVVGCITCIIYRWCYGMYTQCYKRMYGVSCGTYSSLCCDICRSSLAQLPLTTVPYTLLHSSLLHAFVT